ncbi:CAP domain-containing protein [Candidatus Saccharibacteria bacterium]|nr:CAP domain-containing protein [Candidatus Saccharibacteria bacterium]
MPKKPKQSKNPKFIKLLLQNKILLFLLGFAVIGSLIVIVRAATSVSEELYTSSNLAYSYSTGGAISVDRNNNGEVTSYTRPRAIDVSKDGYLYCTPADMADITYRALTRQEQDYLSGDLFYTRPTVTVDPSEDGPFIADEPTIYIDGFNSQLNGSSYAQSDYYELVKKSAEHLEQLCSVPGEAIPSGDSLNIILSQASAEQGEWYQPVAELLAPKAFAGGQPSPSGVNYFGINADFETYQHLLMANTRKSNGIPATQATSCLNTAARAWTVVMVNLTYIKHSNPISDLPVKYCGDGWTKLGENVGVVGLQKPNDKASSELSSQAVFNAFMNSPGHKANILDRQYTHHGIGAYTTSDGKRVFVTQTFWRGKALPK